VEKRIRLFFTLFLIFVVFFPFATDLSNRQNRGFFSDESGYFSIIQSLAYDFDLRYERKDLLRIKTLFSQGPVGFFLKKISEDRYYFAKSFAYPLAGALFFRLFSLHGLMLLNGLMLFFAILMAYYLLRQHHPQPNSLGFSLVFILASVAPVYIWWMTADLFNFFVMFGGLFFFFYRFRRPWLFYLSALFFSFAVFSKPWIVVAVAIVYLILLFRKEWKRFALLSVISVLIFGSFVFFLYQQTGELNYKLFQGGERRSFIGGYPYEDTKVPPQVAFEKGINMSFDRFWQKYGNSFHIMVSNLFYYFFGRFTGMFIYFFPAFFVLILFFFQRKTPEDWFVLAAIIASILMFTQLAPDNYFGGSGSVGNRYFFCVFPLFFFLGFKNRSFKFSALPVAMALIFLSGVYVDSHYHSSTPRYAGLSFPIKLFPPEKTQFLSLPTNENPRAFGKLLHDGEKTYQVYFLDDNYHTIEGDVFWTNGDRRLELFLASPEPVKTFRVEMRSTAPANTVTFDIEHKRKQARLKKQMPYTAVFKNISGLKIKGSYIYHIRVKSDRYISNLVNDEGGIDTRKLGVLVHIGVDY
jgi:hypothetical protein